MSAAAYGVGAIVPSVVDDILHSRALELTLSAVIIVAVVLAVWIGVALVTGVAIGRVFGSVDTPADVSPTQGILDSHSAEEREHPAALGRGFQDPDSTSG